MLALPTQTSPVPAQAPQTEQTLMAMSLLPISEPPRPEPRTYAGW